MLELLWGGAGVIIVLGALYCYFRSGDTLHPGVIMAPPFLYFYSLWPLLMNRNGRLLELLPESAYLYAGALFLFCITALYLGLATGISPAAARRSKMVGSSLRVDLQPGQHKKLYMLAIVLGGIAVLAYAYAFDFSISQFISGYSRHKGGGSAVGSGYIGEAMILCLPAVLILALAVQVRGRLRWTDILLALVLISPQLFQGTLGGRRGPLFISLAVLFFGWCVARGRMPSIRLAVIVVSIIGFLVIVAQANRGEVYLGSGNTVDLGAGFEVVLNDDIGVANEYVAGVTYVEAFRVVDEYYWGYRYLVTLFIRPIPRQLWPTKYEDVGADWLYTFGTNEYSSTVYLAVGVLLPRGVSTGSIADGFAEFSWGAVLMFFIVGRAFGMVWNWHKTRGGYWTILLFLMLALSVYLPVQSFSAWMVRVLFAGIGSYAFWRYFVGDPALRGSAASANTGPAAHAPHGNDHRRPGATMPAE